MAALHPNQRRNTPTAAHTFNIVGAQGETERIGVTFDHSVDEVDLFQRCRHGFSTCHGRRHVHRPELPGHLADAQSGDIGLKGGHVAA